MGDRVSRFDGRTDCDAASQLPRVVQDGYGSKQEVQACPAHIRSPFKSGRRWTLSSSRLRAQWQRLVDGGRRLMHQESRVDALPVRHGLAEYSYLGRE